MAAPAVSQGCPTLACCCPCRVLTVGSRPMRCTAMDTFCTMWKRSPATVMVLPPLGTAKPSPPVVGQGAQGQDQGRAAGTLISPDGAAARADGCDDRVLHVGEAEVPVGTAPALKAHTHGHQGGQDTGRHSAGNASVRAPGGAEGQGRP